MESRQAEPRGAIKLWRDAAVILAAAAALLSISLPGARAGDPAAPAAKNVIQTASVKGAFEVASLTDYLSRTRAAKRVISAGDAPVAMMTDSNRVPTHLELEPGETRRVEPKSDAPRTIHIKKIDPASVLAAALRARLMKYERQQQEAMSGVARAVAASKRREEELTAELKAARAKASSSKPPVEVAAVSQCQSGQLAADYEELRAQLEQERQQNARLNAKLKLAARATDLIFRLRTQAAEPPPAPPSTASESFTNAPVAPPVAAPVQPAPAKAASPR